LFQSTAPAAAPPESPPLVTPEVSIYLDAVRFIAALAVLVGHLDQDGLYAYWLLIGRYSHEGVVIFFVLSGLVITHSTRPDRGGARASLRGQPGCIRWSYRPSC
jgi:hypothetical protein